jgi:hypothetical protein
LISVVSAQSSAPHLSTYEFITPTMAQPSTPALGAPAPTLFGSAAASGSENHNPLTGGPTVTPSSVTSSNNTFLMPNSPVKGRAGSSGYVRPSVTRTLGARPACLVNASLTYCGNNTIYAFGGFDAYTDEVYNHVLKLDLVSHQWSLGRSISLRSCIGRLLTSPS